MPWWLLLIISFTMILFLLAIGLQVPFVFFLITIFGFYCITGMGFERGIVNISRSIATFTLTPIPFFVLMGELLFRSGIATRAIDAVSNWLVRIPGRLSVLACATGVLFGAVSGSTVANAAMLGTLLIPEMRKRGYSKHMCVGPIVAAGGIAMIIPPSLLIVVYGGISGTSISALLIAGIIPGIMLGMCYSLYIIIKCLMNPSLAPTYKDHQISLSNKLKSLITDIIPLFFIIFSVIGTVFLGIATPTEAASLGVLSALVLIILNRRLTFTLIKESAMSTVKTTGMILLIACGSIIFSQLLALSGATKELTLLISNLQLHPLFILLSMLLLVFVLGTMIDGISIMMITIPIFIPIIEIIGFNTVWFGILLLLVIEISLSTPPFGMSLFVVKGVAPSEFTLEDIILSSIPYIVIGLIVVGLIIIFPEIALFLPRYL